MGQTGWQKWKGGFWQGGFYAMDLDNMYVGKDGVRGSGTDDVGYFEINGFRDGHNVTFAKHTSVPILFTIAENCTEEILQEDGRFQEIARVNSVSSVIDLMFKVILKYYFLVFHVIFS